MHRGVIPCAWAALPSGLLRPCLAHPSCSLYSLTLATHSSICVPARAHSTGEPWRDAAVRSPGCVSSGEPCKMEPWRDAAVRSPGCAPGGALCGGARLEDSLGLVHVLRPAAAAKLVLGSYTKPIRRLIWRSAPRGGGDGDTLGPQIILPLLPFRGRSLNSASLPPTFPNLITT